MALIRICTRIFFEASLLFCQITNSPLSFVVHLLLRVSDCQYFSNGILYNVFDVSKILVALFYSYVEISSNVSFARKVHFVTLSLRRSSSFVALRVRRVFMSVLSAGRDLLRTFFSLVDSSSLSFRLLTVVLSVVRLVQHILLHQFTRSSVSSLVVLAAFFQV